MGPILSKQEVCTPGSLGVFTDTKTKKCIQTQLNFIDRYEGVRLVDNYIKAGNHSADARLAFYIEFINNLNPITVNEQAFTQQPPIVEGGYGRIYAFGNDKILKIPKGDNKDMSDFLIELISNVVYHCYRDQIMTLVPRNTGFIWPFKSLTKVMKITEPNGETKIAIVMPKIRYDCWFVVNNFRNLNIYLNILTQVCVSLYGLQQSISFIHRDLHAGNVMINFLNEPTKIEYKIPYKNQVYTEIKLDKVVDVYFIDLGQSCANLSRCSKDPSSSKPILLEAPAGSYNIKPIDGCFNFSHDLRLFCGSISYAYLSKHTPNQTKKILTDLDKLMSSLYNHAYDGVTKIPGKEEWHNLYDKFEEEKRPIRNSIFTPANFFNYLKKFIPIPTI